jgi:2-phosphosulfolactate phosphatase
MNIEIYHLIEGARQAEGLAVIIDVFRAFSTACYAIRNGAKEIIPVGNLKTAYQLKTNMPNSVLMGERGGRIQPGFDYGNSPTQIEHVDFSGKTIIQTTSAGTQGFANAKNAEQLISGSFVNADAIVSYIRSESPEHVSLVCMGTEGVEPSEEDTLCAAYIRERLLDRPVDVDRIVEQIHNCSSAQKFFDPSKTWAPERDFNLCLSIGVCGFVLKAEGIKDDLLSLRPVDISNP